MWGVISIVFGLIETAVGLRFLFLLLGAGATSQFVNWVYNVSHPLVAPFATVFGHTAKTIPGTLQGSSFETASLVALVAYGLVGGILLKVVGRSS